MMSPEFPRRRFGGLTTTDRHLRFTHLGISYTVDFVWTQSWIRVLKLLMFKERRREEQHRNSGKMDADQHEFA